MDVEDPISADISEPVSPSDMDDNSSSADTFTEDDTPMENEIQETSNPTSVKKNVARRGKKRKAGDTFHQSPPLRTTPRRAAAAKRFKSYIDTASNDQTEESVDDPDFNFSDSDNDPDFAPGARDEPDSPPRDLGSKRPKFSSRGRGRGSMSNTHSFTNRDLTQVKEAAQTKSSPVISDNTISSTEDSKLNNEKLSSAYNYAASRTRQNQAVRLPEGPNLSADQLKLIESQFKSGDFVMAKKDTDMMENPPIWRIDGKSLLQKFQAFDKDGKVLYRNISTYSGWTAQAKALYVPVNIKFVFQSRYDVVVELRGFKGDVDGVENENVDKPVWLPKNKDFEVPDELKSYMPDFEIYLQSLISQALDNNFLQEIYEEKDTYFVDKMKSIDDLTVERKKTIFSLVDWKQDFLLSLDTWPSINTMIAKVSGDCQACGKSPATRLSQFYGEPYNTETLRNDTPSSRDLKNKNFNTCDSCSTLSMLYNKVTHQKHDFYTQCKSTVTNMRVSVPNKTTTNVLRDLLANDEWITGLFRSMCTTFVKIDRLPEESKEKNS